MITLAEPKIAGLSPRWAPFPGFSLLFDASPGAYRSEGGVEVLDAGAEGGFYRRIREGVAALNPDRLLTTYGFCALPAASYHVTAYDVANLADLPTCRSESRDPLRALLDRIPEGGGFADPLLADATDFARAPWGLEFAYRSLEITGRVMVVRLWATDEAVYARFCEARADLARRVRAKHSFGAREGFSPHLSLGYFANLEGAELARARLTDWNAALRDRADEARLRFETVSMHGFTSMERFFKEASGNG